MADPIRCDIYKSATAELTYLYLPGGHSLDDLPEALAKLFSDAEMFMQLDLHPGQKLALANAVDVLAALDADGYYLQMPPGGDHPLRKW